VSKKIILLIIVCFNISAAYAANNIADKCYIKNEIVSNELNKVSAVQLPFSSKSKVKNINSKAISSFSSNFFEYIDRKGGDVTESCIIIKLPNICDKVVFISYFVDEGENINYALNVFKNGAGKSVNFGTGSEFWIDEKYNIKVKYYHGKNIFYKYFKVSEKGEILESKKPF